MAAKNTEVTGRGAKMEGGGLFRCPPGGLALADLFVPLSSPMPRLALKDKVKVTIRSNTSVKCLKMKISLPGSPTLPSGSSVPNTGDITQTETGLQVSVYGKEPFPCKRMSSISKYDVPIHMKGKSFLCEVGSNKNGGGTYCSGNKEEHLTSKTADMEYKESGQNKCVPIAREPSSRGEHDADTQDEQHIGFNEESRSRDNRVSDTEHLKHPSFNSNRKPQRSGQHCFHIEEELLSEEDPSDLDGTQIITVKIKDEPLSSDDENDGQPASNHEWEESPSTSRSAEKTDMAGEILPQTVPLLIHSPGLNEIKVTANKETKIGLLKKVMELGAKSDDHKSDRTLICAPERMYKCSKCGRYLTSRVHLMRHYKAHRKHKVPSHVLRHQVVHSKEKPFPCVFCHKHFSTNVGREIHERRHREDQPFTCPDCRKSFLCKAQLKAHQTLHTGERYLCHECGRGYRTVPGLTLHMKIHRGEMSYFCPECGKGFVQKSNLRNHLRVHSNVKGYSCAECGKAFRQSNTLKQHMSMHAAKQCDRYSCSVCGRSYKRKADYRWHMLIHLGEK